ncbi:hypothetical protein KFK09_023794 [Dendrobium nobile]|uniref:Myb-like domain-containing protein n=1 Tax=Dendrobium nobile TaxID=94219 RepID=A0A8T3AC70_DENNO|nr:hypothetical protein KFK09_023794 [Dendrobium nobile]
MQQQGGSQYGVPPLEMVPQFSSASAGARQPRMIGIHGGADHIQHHPAAEAVSPISSRSVPQSQAGVSRSPATFFDELGSGGSGGAVTRSFADEEALAAGDDGERGGSVGSRWPRQETLALLKVRSEMDAAFRDATLKGPLWEDVSRKLAELGYKRSAKKCKEKFENVHKYYKRTKEGRAGRQDGKSYRFFSQLEALHSATTTPATVSLFSSASKTADASVPSGSSMAAPPADRIQPPPPQLSALGPDMPPIAAAAGISFSSNTSSSSSSDSDEDTDDGGAGAGDGSRKRKREGWPCGRGKTMAFFEGLMKQLMEQQEAMQQRFLETIEKREQDRMFREEAWKRQEMARLNREYELMAQERTMTANRDAAVISFLQKFTGGVTNPPNPLLEVATVSAPAAHEPSPPPQEDRPESQRSQQGNEIVIHQPSVSSEPAASAAEVALEVVADGCPDVVSLSKPSPSARWPKAEVLALIKLRSELDMRYLEAGPKGPLWEEISLGMKRLGYNRSAKRCKEKWENINKYFKKVKEGNKKRPEDAKTCPYFHELDALYRRKQQQESAPTTNPAPLISAPAEQESYIGDHKNPVTVRTNIGNGGNHEGSGFQMPRSNANGLSQVFFGGGPNSGSDAALKKPEDIVKELMEQQNHEDDDDDVDDDDYDDDDEEDDGKMRYEIQFQRQSVGAAGSSHGGGNAAGKAPTPAPPTSNAGSFLAMVQ